MIRKIQRVLIENYFVEPIYLNPFVHAIGPSVMPADDKIHHYWDTKNAPYPWPWEVWQVKAEK
jgi:hypothetical protein